MAEIKVMVEGGKASAGAPLGPQLGPLGVDIGKVVNAINEKTKSFAGMKVPVVVIVNNDKSFEIEVGSPPTSALILKEAGVQKGTGNPKTDFVGNLTKEQLEKIAKMKLDNLNTGDLKKAMKIVAGTADSMGITIEGKRAKEYIRENLSD